jgi:hypothetical protein
MSPIDTSQLDEINRICLEDFEQNVWPELQAQWAREREVWETIMGRAFPPSERYMPRGCREDR